MRDFIWNYFSMTGDVDAYLLYKEIRLDDTEVEDPDQNIMDTVEDD
ncbi:MAG: YqzL family protein [Paenibacillaceae bacterium]